MIHSHDPVERVNEKHSDDLLAIGRALAGHPDATSARAEGVDNRGIDLVLSTPTGPVEARVDFSEPVSDLRWMRAAFKDLARRAEAEGGRGSDTI